MSAIASPVQEHLKTLATPPTLDPPDVDMSVPTSRTAARRRGLPPRRGLRDVTVCWLMAGIVVAASWASGAVMPARVVIGGPLTGSTGPIAPTEEHENHSSTSQLVEARGNTRRRDDRADSASHQPAASMFRQPRELPVSASVPPRGTIDGHRLANGLMAPMQI